jgi:hypothetical protein
MGMAVHAYGMWQASLLNATGSVLRCLRPLLPYKGAVCYATGLMAGIVDSDRVHLQNKMSEAGQGVAPIWCCSQGLVHHFFLPYALPPAAGWCGCCSAQPSGRPCQAQAQCQRSTKIKRCSTWRSSATGGPRPSLRRHWACALQQLADDTRSYWQSSAFSGGCCGTLQVPNVCTWRAWGGPIWSCSTLTG